MLVSFCRGQLRSRSAGIVDASELARKTISRACGNLPQGRPVVARAMRSTRSLTGVSCHFRRVCARPDAPANTRPFSSSRERFTLDGVAAGSIAVGCMIPNIYICADRAGLRVGDTIVSVDGASVTSLDPYAVQSLIVDRGPDHEARLGVLRGGATTTLSVILGAPLAY